MNEVNKTLYIPLYGKAFVSRKGLFLADKKAEEIWEKEGFSLKGKAKSKWLAYYMGIRAAVFDDWLREQMAAQPDAVVIQIGCGMDSRILRAGTGETLWYDVDFPEVIRERERYYAESSHYRMIGGDIRNGDWLTQIPEKQRAIMVMEGVSMYLTAEEMEAFLTGLGGHFGQVSLLMDCYSVLAAKLSKYKNPINEVGVTEVTGTDDPETLAKGGFSFVKEHTMTPQRFINQLRGMEKRIFTKLYAGGFSKKLYRLFEYQKG